MLSEKAFKIFKLKYSKDPEETWEQAVWRVVKYVSQVEKKDREKFEDAIYNLIYNKVFIPGGRIIANSDSGIKNLMNCFVLPVLDSRESIYGTLQKAAEIFAYGGGVGFNFSDVREKGALIKSTGGRSSGAISFMSLYNYTGEVIQQASRRGAQLGVLDIDHPDIEKFINYKSELNETNKRLLAEYKRNLILENLNNDGKDYFRILGKTLRDNQLSHFNVSVNITDAFMHSYLKNENFNLISRINKENTKAVDAKYLFNLIAKRAWESGDPGLLFYDRINEDNMVSYLGNINASNPCVTGDSYIYTSSRSIKKIKDLVGKNVDIIIPEQKNPVSAKIFKTGTKPVYKVTFSNGLFINVTEDHKITTINGDKEAKDLIIGKDKINFYTSESPNLDEIAPEFMEELEYELAGFLFGDGTLLKDGRVYINLGEKDLSLLERYKPIFDKYSVIPKQHGNKECSYYLGHTINNFLSKFNIPTQPIIERKLPNIFYEENNNLRKMAGFLRGLWGANGSVLTKYNRIQLKSSNKNMIQDIQQYLALAFGIKSYISTSKKTNVLFKNGEYLCKESYNLTIYAVDNLKFKNLIGFLLPKHIKNSKELKSGDKNKTILPYVKSIEYLGEEDVYDFTENTTHHGIINGIKVHNCSEIPLLPYEPCDLGSLNLHAFYDEKTKGINYEFLEFAVRNAVRFLDNIHDISEIPIEEINYWSRGLRRIGLGVMGFADLLAELEISYGSLESIELSKNLSWFITFFAWLESIELAKEKGAFPFYQKDKANLYVMEKVLNLNRDLQFNTNEIREKGVRNVAVTCIAPTGSTSILADANSGIEPFFSLAYKRNITEGIGNTAKNFLVELNPYLAKKLFQYGYKDNEIEEIMQEVVENKTILKSKLVDDKIKNIFISSHEIPPKSHVDIQAAWQLFISSSISKTVNLPQNSTVEDIEKIFLYMWNKNLKGGTIYRDKSKSFQILNT